MAWRRFRHGQCTAGAAGSAKSGAQCGAGRHRRAGARKSRRNSSAARRKRLKTGCGRGRARAAGARTAQVEAEIGKLGRAIDGSLPGCANGSARGRGGAGAPVTASPAASCTANSRWIPRRCRAGKVALEKIEYARTASRPRTHPATCRVAARSCMEQIGAPQRVEVTGDPLARARRGDLSKPPRGPWTRRSIRSSRKSSEGLRTCCERPS